MTERTYNTAFKWMFEDDYLTNWANYIEHNNVTWLNTGYALTLWPKLDKQLLTNWNAPRTIFGRELTSLSLEQMAVWCDNWEIYKLTSTDNTPEYTLSSGWNIVNWELLLSGSLYMYFAAKDPSSSSSSINIAQVLYTDFVSWSFASINETFLSINNIYTPPMLQDSSVLWIWWLNTVYRVSNTWVVVSTSIFDRYVTWITKQWTQYVVYTDEWKATYWDWVSSTITATKDLWFIPARVKSEAWIDHIITTDWDYYVWSWYTFQLVSRKRQSNRLDDNSQYIKKIDFTPDFITWQSISVWRWGIFIASSDTKPWVYRRESIIKWLAQSFHKSITKDNWNFDFDEVFTTTYLSKGQSKLLIGKQSNTTSYWVDILDLNTKVTAKDWYAVTDVFTGWTTFSKQIKKFRITTSDTSWDNFIKLYFRKNNSSTWTLARTINNSTNTIDRKSITEVTWDFIDIQFKVELHNDNQDDTPPLLHELYLEYTINKNNG